VLAAAVLLLLLLLFGQLAAVELFVLLLSSTSPVPSGRHMIICPAASLPDLTALTLLLLQVPLVLTAASAVVRCHGATSLASIPAALRSLGLVVLLLAGRIGARGIGSCWGLKVREWLLLLLLLIRACSRSMHTNNGHG
jgi:hypothetical protein